MRIEIPVNFHQYIRMLVEARLFPNEEVARATVFRDGLMEASMDAQLIRAPDMDPKVLEGKGMSIEVLVDAEGLKSLEEVREGYRMPEPQAATVVFVQGLAEQYLGLKGTALYESDESFREKVDHMPHDPCYDAPTFSDWNEWDDWDQVEIPSYEWPAWRE